MRRGVLLDLILTSQEGLVEDVKVETVLAVVTMRLWNSGSCLEEAKQ